MKKYLFLMVCCLFSYATIYAQTIASIQASIPVCFGETTGSVTVNINQTNPLTNIEVKLFWQNPNSGFWVNLGTSNGTGSAFSFLSLGAGNYRVDLNNALGNFIEDSFFTLVDPPQLNVSVAIANVSCFGGNDGAVTAAPTGGTGPYFYSWSNGQTVATATNLSPGITYTYTVTDGNACQLSNTVSVLQPTELQPNGYMSQAVIGAGNSNGEITGQVAGGTLPYQYSIDNSVFSSNNIFPSLSAGTYVLSYQDANGCSASESILLQDPAPLSGYVSILNSISCNGDCNGSIQFINNNSGTSPFSYSINGGVAQPSSIFNNLCGDSIYYITMMDSDNSSLTDSVYLSQPDALVFSVSTSNYNGYGIACNGGTGSVSISNPTGGNGAPISYSFDGGNSFGQFWNLGSLLANTYSVAVQDALGCITSATSVLSEPDSLVLNSSITSVTCNGDSDGSITILPTGGVAPFSYLWNDGQITQQATNLISGAYSCVVTDANGCVMVTSVSISEPSILSVTGIVTDNTIPFTSSGAINLSVVGGVASYSSSWSGVNNFSSSAMNIYSLASGTYFLTVQDSNLCVFQDTFEITEPLPVFGCTDSSAINYSANANVNNEICYSCNLDYSLYYNMPSSSSACDGWISVYTPLASGTVNYYWSNGDSSFFIDTLCNGTFSVTVIDANSCGGDTTILLSNYVGCMDSLSFNFDSLALFDNSSCLPYVYGCTDPLMFSFDSLANIDNGTCIPYLYGCTDSLMFNFDSLANTDDGTCIAYISGCTDSLMSSYNPLATVDDSSCYNCSFSVPIWNVDISSISSCGAYAQIIINSLNSSQLSYTWSTILGNNLTTPSQSLSVNLCLGIYSVSIEDDLGCIFIDTIMIGNVVLGCTDSTRFNYNPLATIDDNSCVIAPANACAALAITGLGVKGIIHDRVVLTFDNMNTYDSLGTQLCRVDQLRIKYRAVGTSSWSQKNIAAPTGYDTITGICNSTQNTEKLVLGLSASTTYEWEMRVWYCSTGSTAWVNGPDFTTADNCPNVGNLVVTTPTTTKATFTWDDSNGGYSFVRLKARVDTNAASWFNIGGMGVSHPTFTKSKNGLVSGETYRGQARTWCDPSGGAYKSPTWTSLVWWTQPTSVRLEGSSSISNLDVYPNPSRDVFNISFTSKTVQNLKVRILNVVGEELVNENLEQFVGEYTKQIDLSGNAKGIYFLEIETESGVVNKKLILQ